MTTLCNYTALLPSNKSHSQPILTKQRGLLRWLTRWVFSLSHPLPVLVHSPSLSISALGKWRLLTCYLFISSSHVWLNGCSIPLQKSLCFRERWNGAVYTAVCISQLPRYMSEIRDWGCFWLPLLMFAACAAVETDLSYSKCKGRI